jgi:glutathionylspermidine synthase
MDIKYIPERKNWQTKFQNLGLGHEAETWDDDLVCVFSRREIDILRTSAEQTSVAMKSTLEKCFFEQRLKKPWDLDPTEEAAIRNSFTSRRSLALQRLDYVEKHDGTYALVDVVIDPVDGLLSCAIMQWVWIEEHINSGQLARSFDQFNKLNEALLARLKKIVPSSGVLHGIFDARDQASAALTGYFFNLAMQMKVDFRPVDYQTICEDKGVITDPSGEPIKLCWNARYPGQHALLKDPRFSEVELTTPAWYRLLPSIFDKMGKTEAVDAERRKIYAEGYGAVASVWLLNNQAVAASCCVDPNLDGTFERTISHVVR